MGSEGGRRLIWMLREEEHMAASGTEELQVPVQWLWGHCQLAGSTGNEGNTGAGSHGRGTHCILQRLEQLKKSVKSLTFGTAWLTSQWSPQQTAAGHSLCLLLSPACRDPEEDEEDIPVRKAH